MNTSSELLFCQAAAEADSRISASVSLPDLGLPGFSFVKEPQYENDVIALFMELLTRDHIRGFKVLSSSGGSQYDARCKAQKHRLWPCEYRLWSDPDRTG